LHLLFNTNLCIIIYLKVYSPDERISNILLKKQVPLRDVETSLLLNFQEELKLAYEDLQGNNSAMLDGTILFFGYASFLFEKENGDTILCRLHIGDVVSINLEEGENFAIIRAIFCHQQANNLRLAFIIVDWFEDMNQKVLDCPVFRLRTISNWRKIFSINLVNAINIVHFIHICKGEECAGGDHYFRNGLYMRNMFFSRPFNISY
jgi:hypothetical protein